MDDLAFDDSYDYIHKWFGLSYANYLVIPRSILQSMPTDWQQEFVSLLEKIEEKMNENNLIQQPDYQVTARNRNGKYIKDPYSYYWRQNRRCLGLVNIFSYEDRKDFLCCYYNENGEKVEGNIYGKENKENESDGNNT